MIAGVGIDIVSVERIAKAMRRERFLERLLTPTERKEVGEAEWVAGRWAAKEAVIKALGRPVSFHSIEVRSGPLGAPVASLSDSPGLMVHVSISHERGTAVALAVIERPEL